MAIVYAIVKDQIVPLPFYRGESPSTKYGPTYTEVMEAREVLLTTLKQQIDRLSGSKSKRSLAAVAKLKQRIVELEPIRLYRVIGTPPEIDQSSDLVLCKGHYCGGVYMVPSLWVDEGLYFSEPEKAIAASIAILEREAESARNTTNYCIDRISQLNSISTLFKD